jgi:hypothetical protein
MESEINPPRITFAQRGVGTRGFSRGHIVKLIHIILSLFLIGALNNAVFAQGKYSHLKKWANEYPLDYTAKPKINFFALPEIRQPLVKLLGTQNFKRLMKDFGMVTPMNLIDGYLIIEGVTSNRTPDNEIENAIVAVNINDKAGTIMVIFSGIGERFGQVEYFCTNGKTCSGLPTDVSNKIKEWKR